MLTIERPQLTQEQINLIPIYRRKWQEIARSTERIDREQARLAIKKAYEFIVNDISKYIFNLSFQTGFIINKYLFSPFWQIQKYLGKFLSNKSQSNINMNHAFSVVLTGNLVRKNPEKYQLPNVGISSTAINIIFPSVMTNLAYYSVSWTHEVH